MAIQFEAHKAGESRYTVKSVGKGRVWGFPSRPKHYITMWSPT